MPKTTGEGVAAAAARRKRSAAEMESYEDVEEEEGLGEGLPSQYETPSYEDLLENRDIVVRLVIIPCHRRNRHVLTLVGL